MRIYLGDNRSHLSDSLYRYFGFGRMVVDRRPRLQEGELWALDNGAYQDMKADRHPDYTRFVSRLARIGAAIQAGKLTPPAFVVAPDLIGAGAKGLDYSLRWMDRLDESYQGIEPKFNWYLAVQDGFDPVRVRRHLSRFDGLFVAGSDGFKNEHLASWAMVGETSGKPVHYARCSTPWHWAHAVRCGVDSIDSARPVTRKEYLLQFLSFWLMAGREGVSG